MSSNKTEKINICKLLCGVEKPTENDCDPNECLEDWRTPDYDN